MKYAKLISIMLSLLILTVFTGCKKDDSNVNSDASVPNEEKTEAAIIEDAATPEELKADEESPTEEAEKSEDNSKEENESMGRIY